MATQTRKPRPKVAAAGASGTAATAVIAIAGQLGLDLTPEVAGAVVALASFAAGYLKAER